MKTTLERSTLVLADGTKITYLAYSGGGIPAQTLEIQSDSMRSVLLDDEIPTFLDWLEEVRHDVG